jgi:hypothetical protein
VKRSFRDRLHTGAGVGLLLFGSAFVALSLVALPGLPSNPADRASALFFDGFGIVVGALPLLAGLGVLRGGRWARLFATVVAAVFGTVFVLAAMRIRQSGGSVSVGLVLLAAGALFYLAAFGAWRAPLEPVEDPVEEPEDEPVDEPRKHPTEGT